MKAGEEYLAYIMELLVALGDGKSRAMFDGCGIFPDGDMFALFSSSTLYFKVSGSNRAAYKRTGSARFDPMPYYEVPTNILENKDTFYDGARTAIAVNHATAERKKF